MGVITMIMTLDLAQAAPAEPLGGTSICTNFQRIAWARYRAARPGCRAEGRSIQLQTFVDANGPRRRRINRKGTVTEISGSHLMGEIRSLIQITYPSDMFEFDEDFSRHLEYALSTSHCTTIVSGLKDSGGTYRGEIVVSFGSR
jgi:hypothetical protein